MPMRKINSVRKVGTPSVSQAAKAALRGVWETTHLPTTSAGAKNVRAGTCTPRPPTPSVLVTKLLNRRGFTGAQLLTPAATKASTLRGRTATSTSSSATSTTAAAATTSSTTAATTATAATDAPTPGTTPTTTSTSSTSSTAASIAPTTTPASLALARAASPTRGRRSADLLSANEVDSSNRGEKGDRGTPLKEGARRSSSKSTSSTSSTSTTTPTKALTPAATATLVWHHRLGHPSLPRLHGMHSHLLVSGLPRSLPPLPPSPNPPCLPCVEGQQRAAPHSSFPPTTAPLQTLHMDVWGPAHVNGQSCERYFLLVVDDYTRYTTVFPLRSKGRVVDVLIPWIRTVRLQLRERFGQDLPVLCLHSDRGGEFSSNLLRDFCRGEGILRSFTLPDSPQQNGIAERRIGLIMEVGDASVFRVWESRAFVHDTSADKLSPRAIPCVFLGFVPDAPSWQFYHPTSRSVFPSQDVTFDDSVPFYRLFPYRSAHPPPPPLFLAPGPPPVDPLPPQGLAPLGVSQVDPLPGPATVQVAVSSGTTRGAASGGAASRGGEPGGAESEGAETEGAEPGGVETGESGGAEPQGAASSGGSASASPSLSPQQLREWFVRRARLRIAPGAGVPGGTAATGFGGARPQGTGATGTGGVEGAGAGDATESRAAGTDGSGTGGAGAGGARVGGTGAGGVGVGGPCVGGAGARGAGAVAPGGAVRPRPYFVPLLQQPASRPVSPVRPGHHVPCLRPPPVPGTHAMTLRPSSVPLRVPLPAPPESYLPKVPDPESDHARAASPTVSRLLATAVTDPSFESADASALVAVLFDFAAACRLDYTTALVAESTSASPPSVGGECALGTDVLEDRQEDFECLAAAVPRFASMLIAREGDPDPPDILTPRSYAEAITGPYSSQWQAAMDAKMASWKSTGTYVDEVPPPGAKSIRDTPALTRVLQRFGFQFSSREPTPLSTSHSLSAPPSDESVEPSGPYPELVGCLITLGMGLVLGGRGPVVLTGHADASWVDDSATQRSSQVYTFSLGFGFVFWRSTHSSSDLSSSCEAEIYAGAMAAQELRWLT
ncbi:unnamed protein product [Closterium sp. NIES-53]